MKKLTVFGGWMMVLITFTSFINVTKPIAQEEKKVRCTGYTVIDAHTVQWCDGKIEKKDWQMRIGK